MNRNVMIVLAGGFLIAVLVALLVQASLSGGKKEAPVVAAQQEPKVKIVVAAIDIKVGENLSAANTRWQEWPKSGVFPGAYVQKESEKTTEAVSGRMKSAVKAGEPIVESAVVTEAKATLMATSLAPGMRAMAVEVSSSAMAAGFIGPGDRVDVILTYKTKIESEDEDNRVMKELIENTIDSHATETVLENIKVLAVDQLAVRDDETKPKVGKTVTLEVDRRGAEVLALAANMGGNLSLALRSLGDDKIVGYQYPVVTDARLTNIYDEVIGERDRRENSSGQSSNLVRIYRGGTMEEVAVSP